MKDINEIAEMIGLDSGGIEPYGHYKAKISNETLEALKDKDDGKLVLVTAVNPTPAGEGKTTVSIGLSQAINKLGKKAVAALREPSLGPVFGIKGGAAGGGYSQVVPMEDINLHFTGDMHAITAANNLLSAMIDNHIHQGNALDIDVTNIVWKRVVDMNDRALRHVVVGMGGKVNGIPREDGFMITVASEIMAILCLANDLEDLKKRLGEIIIGYNRSGEPVKASDLKAQGAMAALLKDAIKPNLVQTLEYTPCFIHGGPFANIAHGCNSVQATKLAMKLSDYTITEAGFGADLGAEKFMDIKCRMAGISPDAVVIVATVRALKYNGGVKKTDLKEENVDALKKGIVNLEKHIENMKSFGVPVVVAVNRFDTDSEEELNTVIERCHELGAECALSEVFAKGGEGGLDLAGKVISAIENQKADFKPAYDTDMSIKDKINEIVTKIYGGKGVNYTPKAQKQIARLEELGLDKKPVCMAKTQYSLSDNAKLLGRPENFEITVSNVRISNGAGFIVVETGNIMVMPGLPKVPAADNIDVDADGKMVSSGNPLEDAFNKNEIEVPEGGTEYFQYCTAIPVAALLAQSWNMDLIQKCGDIVGKEMEEFHISVWLAPGMNIHRNPLCGRNFEYYSEDPLVAGMCAAADTRGIQSHAGIGTSIKHFAANNQEDNRMYVNEHISERAMREIYLKGFEIAVKTAQPMTIMSSYNLVNGVHTANSHDLLTAAARDEWGFAGYVMTDWGTSEDMSGLFAYKYNLKYGHSTSRECVLAGNDLQMPGQKGNRQEIIASVADGTLPLGQLQTCAYRILNVVLQSLAYDDCKPYGDQFDLAEAVTVTKA